MSFDLGVHLSVLAGPTVPLPLPPHVAERRAVGDRHRVRRRPVGVHDHARCRAVGSDGRLRHAGHRQTSTLRAGSRVVVVLTSGAVPHVLADGIVTETELTPGSAQSTAELRLTGQDLSLLLDRHEVSAEFPALDDALQVLAIAGKYAPHGLVARSSHRWLDPPADRAHPHPAGAPTGAPAALAARHGYVCYISPGPVPGQSLVLGAADPDGPPAAGPLGGPRPRHERDRIAAFREDIRAPSSREGQVRTAVRPRRS